MGIFGKKIKSAEMDLPPVPADEIGEVQNLADFIWDFEDHGNTTWVDIRRMHEEGFETATRMYRDRITLANHILTRYQPLTLDTDN